MPALSFTVMRDKLLNGTKSQTIRKRRKTPLKVGDKLYIYWKMRTKECKLLGMSEVVSIKTKLLSDVTHEEAIADGFSCRDELWRWFSKKYGGYGNTRGLWTIIKFIPLGGEKRQ